MTSGRRFFVFDREGLPCAVFVRSAFSGFAWSTDAKAGAPICHAVSVWGELMSGAPPDGWEEVCSASAWSFLGPLARAGLLPDELFELVAPAGLLEVPRVH